MFRDIEKLKVITIAVKEKIFTGEKFIESLLGQTFYVHNQTRIQVKNHELYTLQESKQHCVQMILNGILQNIQ